MFSLNLLILCAFYTVVVTDKISQRKGHMNHIGAWILIDAVNSLIWSHHISQWSRFYKRTMVQNIKTIQKDFFVCGYCWHPKSWYCCCISCMPRQVGLCSSVWHSAFVGQYSTQVLSPRTYWYLQRQRINLCSSSGIWHPSDITQTQFIYVATAAVRRLLILPSSQGCLFHRWNKLTFVPGHLGECLWRIPWVGRFFLFPNLKIPCSVDNWGMGAVFPEEPRRCYLKRKASRCIHTGITWRFPNFSLETWLWQRPWQTWPWWKQQRWLLLQKEPTLLQLHPFPG